jgi:hypothetical protein
MSISSVLGFKTSPTTTYVTSIILNNVTFANNSASQGGVFYILISTLLYSIANSSKVIVPLTRLEPAKNTSFINNTAKSGSVFKLTGPGSQNQI